MQALVIVGNELKWLSYYGPFKNRKEAEEWAKKQEFREPWEIADLESPSAYDPRR